MNDIGIREDEHAQRELLKSIYNTGGEGKYKLNWATGYFNLFPEF
jgi:hypothetical protein